MFPERNHELNEKLKQAINEAILAAPADYELTTVEIQIEIPQGFMTYTYEKKT